MATSVKNSAGGLDITATSATETLTGTSFNDTYIVSSLSNKFVEAGPYGYSGGVDTIKTSVLNTLGIYSLESWTRIENLTYTGIKAATLKGNDLDNVIKANSTTATADVLYGGKGNDTLYGYGGADNLQGGDGNDSLYAGVDNDVDTLIGGTGDDTYYDVTNGDIVIETVRGGFDTISTTEKGGRYLDLRNFTHIEGLTYTSATAAALHGNAAGNVINASKSTGAVTIAGYDGDDTMLGGSAVDKLDGGNGNDRLDGRTGADTMIGGKGNDIYYTDTINDVVTELAGEGTDTIIGVKNTIATGTYATTIENVVYTGAGNVAVTGNNFNNVVMGGSGANTIVGGNGNDVVIGGKGVDNVQGNAGNDVLYGGDVQDIAYSTVLQDAAHGTFTLRADGVADTLAGGDGSDLYLIDELGDTITELAADKGTDVILASIDYSLQGIANVEALVLQENYPSLQVSTAWLASGSDKGDVIIGNSDENYIVGGLGDDILTGDFDGTSYWSGGIDDDPKITDVVEGGDGNDILLAMASMHVSQWNGNTSVSLSSNIDNVLLGGAGNDFYIQMNGDTEIEDSAGTDVLYLMTSDIGGTKNGIETIVLAGGRAIDDAKALGALNRVREVADLADRSLHTGTSPYAPLTSVPGAAALKAVGNELANTIYGNGYDNDLSGGDGDDILYGGAGNDVLRGDKGNDRLEGGIGDDVYVIDAGDTVVEKAGEGIDMIRSATLTSYAAYANIEGLEYTGSTGVKLENGTTNTTADRLYGGSGNDTINGYGGNDDLRGNDGNDTINGGDGADSLRGGLGNDTLNGGDGIDTIYGGLGADILNGGTGNDKLYGNDNPFSGDGDAVDLGNTIHGDAGSDTIYGGSGADKLYGDADNDIIYGGLGVDTIDGGDGNDTLSADGLTGQDSGINTLIGGKGNDTLNGAEGADTLSGGDDTDTLYGNEGNDKLDGDAGNDNLYGGEGNDTLNGGAGTDNVSGQEGNDIILADADGNDTISGGDGDDIIYAGTIVKGVTTLTGQDRIFGGDMYGTSEDKTGSDTIRFSETSLSQIYNDGNFKTGHQIGDFVQGRDQIEFARALVGDGDAAIEGGVVKSTTGGTFSSTAELVIFGDDIADMIGGGSFYDFSPISGKAVTDVIGSADKAFAIGDERLFVVDDGDGSAVFKFTSKDASAIVTADELELVAVVIGQADLALTDFGVY